jgi:hypothetical protein
MKMKTIQNEHHSKLCDIINTYCGGKFKAGGCYSTMKEASKDDNNTVYVYDYDETNPNEKIYDIDNILKLDDFSDIFTKNHHIATKAKHPKEKGIVNLKPQAVDAVCIDENNHWYLIEFKNQKLEAAEEGAKEKMLSSLWLLFYTYSVTGNGIDDTSRFARENISYIIVIPESKDISDPEAKKKHIEIATRIHTKEAMGKHYTPGDMRIYEDYYFKEIFIYTERELRSFIAKFR